MSEPTWPSAPDKDPKSDVELQKLVFEAEVQDVAAARKRDDDQRKRYEGLGDELKKKDWDAEYALDQEFHKAVLSVAEGSIERSRTSAQLLQGGAAAVGTLYTGVIALVFAQEKNPLPLRGLMPVLFLGLIVAFAMAYLAYIARTGKRVQGPVWTASNRENQWERLEFFLTWTRQAVTGRANCLRAAVVSLALGVVFLPAPFLRVAPAESEPEK